MSGYATKAEAMEVLKLTIQNGRDFPSRNPKDYYIGRVFDEMFTYQGPTYRWRLVSHEESHLTTALTKHMRPSFLARVEAEHAQENSLSN